MTRQRLAEALLRIYPGAWRREYGEELREDGRPVVTICESGARAAVAASVLAAAGVEARPVLNGGIPDWEARGGSTVGFRRCGS